MNRRLLALLLAVPLVALAFVAVVGPSAPPPPYVEYGEPADRPYVVLRVYGGPVFDVNDTVVVDVVLVNPWDRNATVGFDDVPWARLRFVAANGTIVYGVGSLSLVMSVGYTLGPGQEFVYWRVWWRPGGFYWGIPLESTPYFDSYAGRSSTVDRFGPAVCRLRGPGETYTIEVDVLPMHVRTEDGNTTWFDTEPIVGSVAFTGTPSPCFAENPYYLFMRVNGETVTRNDTLAAALDDTLVIDLVLVNPRDGWLNLSLDAEPVVRFAIVAANGTTMYASDPYPTSTRIGAEAVSLPPQSERLLARYWWNQSGVEPWPSWWPGPADFRLPGEAYRIVAWIPWLTLWDGPPYDWDATPAPMPLPSQKQWTTVTFT